MQGISKICTKCGATFEISEADLAFYDKMSPIFNEQKYQIPSPNFCPDCRRQRRASYHLEKNLYKRKCYFSGKALISMYSPEKKDVVYDYDIWWSDQWDAMDYAQEFDFDRSFFQQIYELSLKVPKSHIDISTSENSIYTNQAGFNKDCYLVFEAGFNKNCLYSYSIFNSQDSIDCLFSNEVQNCYQCIDVKKSYNLNYSQESSECRDSYYLYDCHNCKNCIGCWNLNGKQFYILNKAVSKEEYEQTWEQIQNDKDFQNQLFNKYIERKTKEAIHKPLNNVGSENVVGNNITQSQNCSGFNLAETKDCNNCQDVYSSENCMDYSHWGNNANHIYEGISIGNNSSRIIFSYMCYDNVNDLIYCMNCANNCSNCFGCVGLKNKQYCIFNKQYSKEEYEKMVPLFIEHMIKNGEWGEFFPSSISPFGYNESTANGYFPLEKEEAINQGNNWQDVEYPINIPENMARIEAQDLPELKDLNEELEKKIVNTAIICEESGKPYRITQQELIFYKKQKIPLPKKHQDIRHIERMKLKAPRKIYDRKCDKCGVEIKTIYAPNREETVFCQDCYNKEIY